jgi:uncharacterized protein (TIGR00297 family)
MQLLLGFLFALIVALAARATQSLSRGGALAATLVGALIFGIGGWGWAMLLLTFFVTSSALSHAFQNRKRGLSEKFSKGHERDAGQVFGNGGVATFFALLHGFFPQALWPWLGFAAALAAVNADTWATELGVLNPTSPRLITDLRKRVEKGTSGGISLWGTLAALTGAAAIAAPATILAHLSFPTFLLLTLAGLGGSLFDSWLGATVQAIYFCPTCEKETERHPLHTCGSPTRQIRGWGWLDNDRVNFAAGAAGALLALLSSWF